MKSTDWASGGRAGVLAKAHMWMTVFIEETTNSKGEKVRKHFLWEISAEVVNELGMRYGKAQEALTAAQEKETRTKVATAACNTAFKALIEYMRFIKKRWLHIPPLSNADYVSLGFSLPDETHSASGGPTGQVIANLSLSGGRHELRVKARYLKGSPDDKANKVYEYWYVLRAPGEKAPESPAELTKLFDTRRQNDTILFEYEDSGKIAYTACRLANGKKKGPWGPIVSALIP